MSWCRKAVKISTQYTTTTFSNFQTESCLEISMTMRNNDAIMIINHINNIILIC